MSLIHGSVRRVSIRTRGFALVVALAMIAFILMLSLSLASFTLIEVQRTTSLQKLTLARQNALLGLEIALGKIQEYAGPDQRITAPSSINAAVESGREILHPYWTGVWQQNPSNVERDPQFLAWLVSGDDTPADPIPDPNGMQSPTVWLVGAGSVEDANQYVKLRKQKINEGGAPIGHYAWWASDESMKANLALVDPAAQRPNEERIQSFLVAQRTGIEQISEMEEFYPVNDPLLQRIVSPNDLALSADNLSQSNAILAANRAVFHDVTTYSQGLLTDTIRGGLKKDLTAWLDGFTSPNAPQDDDFIFPPVGSDTEGLPRWKLIRSYAQIRDNGDPIPPRRQTDVEQGVHPVITYSHLGIGVSCEGNGKPFRVQLFPRVVLWNPTSVTIKAQQYEFGIAVPHPGGARIDFYKINEDGEEIVRKDYLTTLHLGHGVLDDSKSKSGESPVYFRFTVDAPDIPPGASLVFAIADSEFASEYVPGKNIMRADSSDPEGAYVVMTSDVIITLDELDTSNPPVFLGEAKPEKDGKLESGRTYAALRIKPTNDDYTSGTDYGGDFLYHIRGAGFGGLGTPIKFDFVGEALKPDVGPRTEIAMRRAASEIKTPLFSLSNFSAPESARAPHDTGSNHSQTSALAPMNITIVPPNSPNNSTPYWRASVGTSLNSANGRPNDIQIREFLPANVPIMSIGQLQNVTFSNYDIYPAWAVGNSLAPYRVQLDETSSTGIGSSTFNSTFNRVYDLSYLLNQELWDRYFFSTIPNTLTADDIQPGYRPPNSRLKLLPQSNPELITGSDAFDTRAAALVIDGPFNINSTSVKAWSAMLASMNGLDYDPISQTSGTILENPFSRYVRPDKNTEHFFDKTYRSLSQSQIDQLAAYIVEEIKARGPFLSLADFINRRLEKSRFGLKGTLQAAIDQQSAEAAVAERINYWSDFPSDQNQTAGDGVTRSSYNLPALKGGDSSLSYPPKHPWNSRFAFAPGYLTQADILTALGPALTARSDTFRVRAYGDVVNPLTGEVEARAWCEAIVQRSPDYVDGNLEPWETPVSGSVNATFGRSFRIISLRWLSENEI